jgi:putative membrane protein
VTFSSVSDCSKEGLWVVEVSEMNNEWHGNGWGGGQWVAMILMMVVFWAVIAAIAISWARSSGRSRHEHHSLPVPPAASHDAERILHERFARGEIDEDEYTRRHELLKERSR